MRYVLFAIKGEKGLRRTKSAFFTTRNLPKAKIRFFERFPKSYGAFVKSSY